MAPNSPRGVVCLTMHRGRTHGSPGVPKISRRSARNCRGQDPVVLAPWRPRAFLPQHALTVLAGTADAAHRGIHLFSTDHTSQPYAVTPSRGSPTAVPPLDLGASWDELAAGLVNAAHCLVALARTRGENGRLLLESRQRSA